MPIDNQHALYAQFYDQWYKCRLIAEGEDTVKAADNYDESEQVFLPIPEGMTRNEYNSYKKRATFYNATGRTIEVLKGLIFRKEPRKEVPESVNDFLGSVTATGESIDSFARQIIDEMLTTTRGAVLVDFPQTDIMDESGNVIQRTLAQAESLKEQPYFSFYNAESIINWKTTIRNNESVLEWVILREYQDIQEPDDEYKYNEVEVFRKLYIDGMGHYFQEVWGKNEAGEFVIIEGPIMPLMNGKPLDYIPFIYFNGLNMNISEIHKPMLLDLVNVNISHYRTSADLEHALHFTALPTAVITGIRNDKKENQTFFIGSAAAWLLPKDANAFFLEFQGHGIEPSREVISDKEQQMSKLGARLLAVDKKAVEAAQTAEINRAGESASLADRAILVSMVITEALKIALEWMGVKDAISYLLNTDFMPLAISPETLNSLMKSWQAGGMSFETLYFNMQRGELTRPGISAEDEKTLIDMEMPEPPMPGEDNE